MGKVTLYSTHCPKCNVLEKKLGIAKIDYDLVTDVDIMQQKGFKAAPVLEIDGEPLSFMEALKWIAGDADED